MATTTAPRRHRSLGMGLGPLLVLAGLPTLAPMAHAGSWQTVGSLTEGRNYPKVNLLDDGTVLVTGGQGSKGGRDFPLRTAERFDPKTNTFTALPSMSHERLWQATLRLQDGRVLVVGGVSASGQSHNTAELYDPASGTFSATGQMNGRRMAPTATLLPDGRVLVVGGWTSFVADPVATAEIYDPTTGTFQPTGSMAVARAGHHAFAMADGRVAILGGFGASGKNARGVEIYDPATGTFTPGGELTGERDVFSSAVKLTDGRILLAGGEASAPNGNKKVDNTIEIYDPATGKSALIGSLVEAREEQISVMLPDGRVLVAGGWALPVSVARARSSAEVIDPATGKASLIEPMAFIRANAAALLLPDGRVLVLGGIYPGGHRLPAEVYVP